jgi:hypothetical protein
MFVRRNGRFRKAANNKTSMDPLRCDWESHLVRGDAALVLHLVENLERALHLPAGSGVGLSGESEMTSCSLEAQPDQSTG